MNYLQANYGLSGGLIGGSANPAIGISNGSGQSGQTPTGKIRSGSEAPL